MLVGFGTDDGTAVVLAFDEAEQSTRGKITLRRFYSVYLNGLVMILKNRSLSFLAIAGLFAAAIFGLGTVPNIFFPANDRGDIYFRNRVAGRYPIGPVPTK